MNIQKLENELWVAADQVRANSKLSAAEYNTFKIYLPEIEAGILSQMTEKQREELIPFEFRGKATIYQPESARFDRIANLPQGASVGAEIDGAMDGSNWNARSSKTRCRAATRLLNPTCLPKS